MDARSWADLHGERWMTMAQFRKEEERAREDPELLIGEGWTCVDCGRRWPWTVLSCQCGLEEEELAHDGGFCCVMAAMRMGHDEDCEEVET